MVGIPLPETTVIGIATELSGQGTPATCIVNLLGEIRDDGRHGPTLIRGAAQLPRLGQAVLALTREELASLFSLPGATGMRIGDLHQNAAIGAYARIDDLITKHFAVLGSTGAGKSSGISVLVGAILDAKPDLRVFFIDPHNEYGSCFHPRADVLRPANLRLPFWLFSFEEFVDVLFRGRPGVDEEIDILAELIPAAKAAFAASRASHDRSALKRMDAKAAGIGPDTPIPYRLADLVALIEERRGKLENRALVFNYTRLLNRIETVRLDTRYAFMFDNANVGGDTMVDVIGEIFKYPGRGKTVTVMQLAGFPSEVVDSVVSVLCRMAFEIGLWSDGALPMLLVCEEAHRYAPADRGLGFGPTRKALSRIAKEGRKYGIYLGLVTQRPAELDPTILSQCSTVFAMRLMNDRDQAILRAAVSEAAGGLLGFLPSLGTREAFGFGEGMPLPMRIRFSELPAARIPRSEATGLDHAAGAAIDRTYIAGMVERWRGGGVRPLGLDEGPTAPIGERPTAPLMPAQERPPVLDDGVLAPGARPWYPSIRSGSR
ncbi:DUF87 domain-containing protein [Salinarimonas soli]|uniref:DUF87 domain-containing protein n=2 Tax=Salinarimonas soli TaxID=1638099 RepID=A0A5B2VUA9_9HYPH|nr:DUF87 domain-containing protein [Salinarimonas soli]